MQLWTNEKTLEMCSLTILIYPTSWTTPRVGKQKCTNLEQLETDGFREHRWGLSSCVVTDQFPTTDAKFTVGLRSLEVSRFSVFKERLVSNCT